MQPTDWLVLSGLLLIFLLAGYAAWLWYRVWRNRQRLERARQARNQRLAGDIRVLAQALLDGQLPAIEGAIRLKVLLDNYSGARPADLDIEVLETLYNATAHIPTHAAWKELPLAERRQYERHMAELEQQHREALLRSAETLRQGLE